MKDSLRSRLFGWLSLWAGVAFLLPNHYSPWLSVHQEWAMAVGFAPLCVWAALQKAGQTPAIAVVAWLLALVPWLQFACGQVVFAGDAWMASLYLSAFGFSVLAGARYVSSSGTAAPKLPDLVPLWVAIVFAGLVSMGMAFHQWLDLRLLGVLIVDLPPLTRVFANLAQPNHFATLLLLGLAGLVFLFEVGKLRALPAMVTASLFTFGLVMTGSRSAVLGVLGGVVLYALLRRRCKLTTSWRAVAWVCGFYVVAAGLWPPLNQALLLEDSASNLANRLYADVRVTYWVSMSDAISRSPWGGYGWGQIPLAQQAVALAHRPTYNFFESAHNLFLDLVVWNGLPAGLAVTALLLAWCWGQLRTLRDPLAWCLLLGTGVVLNHAMVELPLYYAYFMLPVGFFMGVLSYGQSPWPVFSKWDLPPAFARGLTATGGGVTLAVFITVSLEYPRFEADWQQMRYEEQRIGDHQGYVPPKAILLTQLEQLLKFIRTEARPGMSTGELNWMRDVSSRFGYSSALYRYALAAGLNGQPEQAARGLRLVCSLHPPATCEDARKNWTTAAQPKWPQLANIPFPADAGKSP